MQAGGCANRHQSEADSRDGTENSSVNSQMVSFLGPVNTALGMISPKIAHDVLQTVHVVLTGNKKSFLASFFIFDEATKASNNVVLVNRQSLLRTVTLAHRDRHSRRILLLLFVTGLFGLLRYFNLLVL